MIKQKDYKGFKFIKNNDKMILRDIKEYFEDPNIYLKENKRFIIGKSLLKKYENKINNNKDEDKGKIENEEISVINKDNKITHKPKRLSSIKNVIDGNHHYLTEGNNKRPLSVGIHYKFKTTKEILNTYEESKKREEKNKEKGTNFLIPKNVNKKVKNQFINQGKKLKLLSIENSNDIMFADYLTKKLKINKEKLLFNTIENHRIKNQYLDYIENDKNIYEKFGNFCWYMNLRRPNILNKSRCNYVNNGNIRSRIWEPIVDNRENNVEIIKITEKPYEEKNNFNKIFMERLLSKSQNKNVKNKNKYRSKIIELSDINDIIIKGKNVISLEKENFLKYKNNTDKYRVFKDPREENKRYCDDCTYKLNYIFNNQFNKILNYFFGDNINFNKNICINL